MSANAEVASSTTEGVATERVMCVVKWFDSKKGWGFARTLDEPHRDIFVHHKAITVAKEQYRYLVQGEYVELEIVETTEGEHQYQAGNVSGIKGGALMCETREAARAEQDARMVDHDGETPTRTRGLPRSGLRRMGPRGNRNSHPRAPREGDEFILVRKN